MATIRKRYKKRKFNVLANRAKKNVQRMIEMREEAKRLESIPNITFGLEKELNNINHFLIIGMAICLAITILGFAGFLG